MNVISNKAKLRCLAADSKLLIINARQASLHTGWYKQKSYCQKLWRLVIKVPNKRLNLISRTLIYKSIYYNKEIIEKNMLQNWVNTEYTVKRHNFSN